MTNFKESTVKTKTFEAKFRREKFFVDIVESAERAREAWIYTDKMGVKDLMFGNGYCDEEQFFELVKENFEDYAEMYMKRYY